MRKVDVLIVLFVYRGIENIHAISRKAAKDVLYLQHAKGAEDALVLHHAKMHKTDVRGEIIAHREKIKNPKNSGEFAMKMETDLHG
jgi:hypothetical protein